MFKTFLVLCLIVTISLLVGLVEASNVKNHDKLFCWLLAIALMIGIGVCL